MAEIRIKSGVVIEVNDAGETITMNVEDQLFIEKFYKLIHKLDDVTAEMKEATKTKNDQAQLSFMMEKTKDLMTDIDGMFGEKACEKVFGHILPSPYLIADFFEQLTPIAEEYTDARQKRIEQKYNNQRKGSRSKYRTKEEIIQDAMR